MISPLGPPTASGRSADLWDRGDGTMLRRRRDGDIPAHEAAAMRLAEEAGFPVPHVHSVEGPTMVLDRIDGTDMLDILGSRPWRARRYGRLLGDLHLQLRRVTPSDPALAGEPRDALVHGDLHPGNVMMTADGPVVIDWESARAGPADFDAATTWLLMEIGEVDDVALPIRVIITSIRRSMTKAFLARVGRPSATTVDAVCALRVDDRNMRPTERDRIRAFRLRHGTA